ncbi:MAG TPA: GH92 family glycosyl hydrolase [Trebonia sp.]|jgi:predicted alpha-1,2-mannosidase|nr:GH92 family glycosyl hydrolase [Trebonia sp.]
MTAASTLMLAGVAQASTTPSASASARPSPSASAAPSAPAGASGSGAVTPVTAGKPGGTCAVTKTGHLTDCQQPVATSKLPAGARNKSTMNPSASDLASLVDTRTWTTGGGNTFPGADVPYGMVQWSPDTLPDRNEGGGYSYTDTTLTGYSLTHVSGPGCGAGGDVPILPVTGALPSGNPNNVTTPFSHTGEVAQAGYYSASSNGTTDPITSQFTATTHSSMGQFTFPSGSDAGFDIKLQDGQNTTTADTAQVVGNDEVEGSVTSGDFCGESVNDGQSQLYTVYFDIKFNQPFTTSQVITASGQTSPEAVYVDFGTSTPVVQAKVGISFVSTANAALNWQTENPGWNFGAVKTAAQNSWDKLLGKIKVSGGSYSQTQEFYSLLYKDFLDPQVTSDVNGQFMGANDKVETVAKGQQNQYGMYSGWDIYHTLAQLQAMLDPSAASDQAQSQVNYYSEDSILQQWGYYQDNNYVMVGDPEDAIISDYYTFGGKDFNTKQALSDMLTQATTTNDVRPGEGLEQKYGYLPEDGAYNPCCNAHGVIATQLEDDNADFALSTFAQDLGDTKDAAMLKARANNWENVFDPNNDLLTARYENGQFEQGITPTTQQNNEPDYVEGDAYEYLWDTPDDYQTLFNLLGGDSKVAPALQSYVSQPNGNGMYDEIANEFDLGEQFGLDYAGDPAGTQAAVHNIENTVYLPGPSGLDNNDDLGAESSSFLWQELGLYPENPGDGTLLLNSPAFPHAQISLSNGKTITINAPDATNEYYVKSLKINGQSDQKLSTTYSDLSKGATLDWTLSPKATSWGSAPQDAPPSDTSGVAATVGYLGSQTATVAPGSSSTVTVGANNATDRPQKVKVSITAPAGVTITPSSTTIEVPPHGQGTAKLTVSAASGTAQNYYTAPVTMTTESTGASQSLTQTVLVAATGSLLSTFNNEGISADSNPSTGNFDGDGYSYSADALAADGFTAGQTATVNGVSFTWPRPAPGYPDNTVPDGQQLTVNAPAGTQTLAFLGSASNGPSNGVITENYSDGTTQQYWLGLTDWTLNGGGGSLSYGNQKAASTTYRNCDGCTSADNTDTYMYYTAVPVNPGKTLTSVTLPSGSSSGELHLFSVGTSTNAMTGPVVTSLSSATASAGQQVTITGSGFGSSQGNGYVAFSDNNTNWGAPGNTAPFTIDSWSDTSITFTVPAAGGQYNVATGTAASVTVVDNSGDVSDAADLEITPTDNPADYYDNTGISNDGDTTCQANFDGDGYSYSAEALAAAGLTPGGSVTADGVTFTWPNVASCAPDNILADGQTMLVNGTAGASELGLLESSSNGGSSGPITITYTDGTSTTETLSSSDWANGPGTGETAAATMTYRNADGGTNQAITMYIYATTVPVDSSKTVASVTFPDIAAAIGSNSAMHIFAVGTN